MFFKGISALLAAAIAYFIYQNGFDTQMSVYFALMPIATLMGYLLLGVSD